MSEPLYQHNCDSCVFLGTSDDVDMYYHMNEHPALRKVIARFSSEDSDYTSGWEDEVVIFNPYLTLAKKRALQVKEVIL